MASQSVTRAAPRRTTAPAVVLSRHRVRTVLGHTEWVLAGVAVLFLAAYAWPILDARIAGDARSACADIVWGTYAVFVLEYAARVWSARDRAGYFRGHLLDLLIVALPVLKPLRLLRLLVLFRLLNRKAASALRGRVPVYVTASAAMLIGCGALAVLNAERRAPGTNITGFGNALWWAVTTVTTVGYGDHYPVTVEGRCIAVGLMIGGVALIGVVTASFAAWFIDRVRDDDVGERTVEITGSRDDLAVVLDRLDALTAEIAALRARERQDGAEAGHP